MLEQTRAELRVSCGVRIVLVGQGTIGQVITALMIAGTVMINFFGDSKSLSISSLNTSSDTGSVVTTETAITQLEFKILAD